MPLPMPRAVMSSPSHMTTTAPAVKLKTMRSARAPVEIGQRALAAEQERYSRATVTSDRPTVSQRVYLVISFWPCSPSLASASSLGMTTVRSCMMMEAVMYGMMPRANTATLATARRPRTGRGSRAPRRRRWEEVLQRGGIDARHGHVSAEAVDREHARREEQLARSSGIFQALASDCQSLLFTAQLPCAAARGARLCRRPPRSSPAALRRRRACAR